MKTLKLSGRMIVLPLNADDEAEYQAASAQGIFGLPEVPDPDEDDEPDVDESLMEFGGES